MKFTPLALAGLVAFAQATPDLGDDLGDLADKVGDNLDDIPDELKSIADDNLESLKALPTAVVASLSGKADEWVSELSDQLLTATGSESARITSLIAVASNLLEDAAASATDVANAADDDEDDDDAGFAPTAAIAFTGLVAGVAVFFNL